MELRRLFGMSEIGAELSAQNLKTQRTQRKSVMSLSFEVA
jgi:hypothetical protein